MIKDRPVSDVRGLELLHPKDLRRLDTLTSFKTLQYQLRLVLKAASADGDAIMKSDNVRSIVAERESNGRTADKVRDLSTPFPPSRCLFNSYPGRQWQPAVECDNRW